jgi:3-hydroxyisobutyrate dehydrogenase
VQLAKQFNLDIPVAKQALSQLKTHQDKGYAEADLATVIQLVKS